MTTATATGTTFGGSSRFDRERQLREIRQLAHLLDDAFRIPIIGRRIGLDGLLGLIPVVGDISGFAISGYLIYKAARLGVPRRLIARMLLNAFIEFTIGAIPLLGDVFDIFWKSNLRNLRLLERHLERYA